MHARHARRLILSGLGLVGLILRSCTDHVSWPGCLARTGELAIGVAGVALSANGKECLTVGRVVNVVEVESPGVCRITVEVVDELGVLL